jgi:hypothetical protein
MSIFIDSYQTTVGSAYVTKQIETAIKESIIKDDLNLVNLKVRNDGKFIPIFITGSSPSEDHIPLFTHPITIFNFQNKNYLCTDLRLYVRKGTTSADVESGIKNKTEYNFIKSRAILNLIWLNDGPGYIKNNLSFASTVYSAWLSEIISRTYALDFKDQTTLAIISSFFYQTLFTNDKTFTEDTLQKMAIHTINATKAPANLIYNIFDRIESMANINDFCSTVVSILENTRLDNFNLAMLLTLIRNSWYGTNAKEIISVAIEHPPTWNALVYTSLTERTYSNSNIYKIAERFGKKGASTEYIKNYTGLIKNEIESDNEIIIREFH